MFSPRGKKRSVYHYNESVYLSDEVADVVSRAGRMRRSCTGSLLPPRCLSRRRASRWLPDEQGNYRLNYNYNVLL